MSIFLFEGKERRPYSYVTEDITYKGNLQKTRENTVHHSSIFSDYYFLTVFERKIKTNIFSKL